MRVSALYSLGCWAVTTQALALPGVTKRSNSLIPAPISVPPSEEWEGIDGQWNTFTIRIGNPEQVVRVLLSTTSQLIWTIDPGACYYQSDKNTCAQSRGDVFYSNVSTTWQEEGFYELFIEKNLNLSGDAMFGYDQVSLGYLGQGGPTLRHQIVGAFAVEDFWFGHFGLHPKTTNFTSLSDNIPSYVTTLKTQNLIPSVSWGYTQGASYRFSKVPASLTLGGYDRNRFVANNITFPLAPNTDRDLVISINTISTDAVLERNSSRSNKPDKPSRPEKPDPADGNSLLESPVYAFIDSTVAEMWLPQSACRKFERAFNLDWDFKTQLYTVNDAVHDQLLAANPNISFTLSPNPGSPIVSITFPYAAFDLLAKAPYRGLSANTRYFPLRRATNESQYTLGRVFLQEAYLMVDWERQNFSISQVDWTPNARQHLVPIKSLANTSTEENQGILGKKSSGTVAGIATSIIVVVAIIAILSYLVWRNRKKAKEAKAEVKAKMEDSDAKASPKGKEKDVAEKAELDAGQETTKTLHEKDSFYAPGKSNEPFDEIHADLKEVVPFVEAPENVIFELPGDVPPGVEAGGRELSEKEAMQVREDRYNGVNPNPTTPTRPVPTGNSPVSPITPSTTTNTTSRTAESAIISPISATSAHRTIDSALSTPPRKKKISGADIEPIRDDEGQRIPLRRAESERVENTEPATARDRNRFSWED